MSYFRIFCCIGLLLLALLYVQSVRFEEVEFVAAERKIDPAERVKQIALKPEAEALETTVKQSYYSEEMQLLLQWIDEGKLLSLQIGEMGERKYTFRPTTVTAPNFKISSSPTEVIPSSWKVYDGHEFLATGQLGDAASLAVVNDSVSIALVVDGVKYLVETDPQSQTLVATELKGGSNYHGTECDPVACSHAPSIANGSPELFGMRAPIELSDAPLNRQPVSLSLAGSEEEEETEPTLEAAWVDNPYFRLGPEYDASLKDILILMVSGSTQTGSSANLSSRAATYLTYAARVADTYERQLGLRYLLQELVLIANDSGQDDIEYDDSVTPNNSGSGADDLGALEDWCHAHRPQSIYGWGHAAGWTLVEGGGGGTIGWAWLDAYGSSSSAYSVQERNFDWDVHSHELGHNVGASHTNGGVMSGFLSNNNENFFAENEEFGGYTAAMDIYNYMSSSSRRFVFGSDVLRHAEEIPFGIDDSVSTAENTAVTFSPLSNDETSVFFGATNVLRLVEVGQVYPKAAGVVEVIGDQIRFTPALDFTGNVWFTYTLSGNVGNGGLGWLHSADVVVTVGGDSAAPSETPVMDLTDDLVYAYFSEEIRVNPLLNDEGTGRLWAGDVDVLSQIDGAAEVYSEQSFYLVGATVLSGNGTVSLETIAMTRDATSSLGNTGYLIYTPAVDDLASILIEYTVEDAFGNQSTATLTLSELPTVSLSTETSFLIEQESRVVEVSFTRGENADASLSEEITFALEGDVTWFGSDADIAIVGFDTLDSSALEAKIVIPEGQYSQSIFLTPYSDLLSEGSEDLRLTIIDSESLPVDAVSSIELTIQESATSGLELYSEDFDAFSEPSGIGVNAGAAWSNETGEIGGDTHVDWEVESGTTSSSNTGPNGDNTSGSGNYLFVEASFEPFNKSANLVSPSFDLSDRSSTTLEFAYHMYGSNMGDLHVDLREGGGAWVEDIMLVLSGQQSVDGGDWKTASIDISSYLSSDVQIRFRAITGSNFRSDICIDDFRLSDTLFNEPVTLVAEPEEQALEISDSLYLAVAAQAFPAPTYQWKRDGVDIPGATHPAYYLESAIAADSGNYTVEVRNGDDVVVSSVASVVVGPLSAPVIEASPESVSVTAGEDVSFSVTASGIPSVSYQWRKNDLNISDGIGISGVNTSELVLSSVDSSDAGSYSCVVSNSEGSTTSASASLAVSEPGLSYDQSWKDLAFGPGENGADTDLLADFNGDGRLNIFDYAFQIITSLSGDEVGKLPSFELAEVATDRFAEISFRRIKGGAGDLLANAGYSVAGINYVVECSDTLAAGDWATGSDLLELVGSPVDNSDETETVVVRLKNPVDAISAPTRFIRIKIEAL